MTTSLTKIVNSLSSFWNAQRCERLLHTLDYFDTDGYNQSELRELALLALQDTEEPDKAGRKVLQLIFGDSISFRHQEKLVSDLQNARLWSQLSKRVNYTELIAAANLLNRAFPDVYPDPTVSTSRVGVQQPFDFINEENISEVAG